MPEGPELHLSARFVKKVGDARRFVGNIVERLPPSRSPKLDELNSRLSATGHYTVTSWSRGKELMLAIKPLDFPKSEKYRPEEWSIRFNFGMTGCFKFTRTSELPKHAKVCFSAVGEPACTLSFVDMRGFGRWTPTAEWSENRGPCIIQEHDLFRAHVLGSLEASAFNKPICEVMLDQRYFNGVGNYLRAEALHRLGVAPFTCARDLLSPLPAELKPGRTDLLHQCHQLAAEVVSLGGGRRYDVPLNVLQELTQGGVKREEAVKEEEDEEEEEVDAFEEWLQCYYQPGMKNLVDHQGRTVWFAGNPGPMAPKARKQRHGASPKKSKPSKTQKSIEQESPDDDYIPAEKRAKRGAGGRKSAKRGDIGSADVGRARVKGKGYSSEKAAVKEDPAEADEKPVSVNKRDLNNGTPSREPSAKKGVGKAKRKSSVGPTKTKQSTAGKRRSKRLSTNVSET